MKRYSQQQIEDLLDKFMNGLTTMEEESALGDYFRTHEVPQEWEDYRLMFDYFDRRMEGELLPKQPSLLMGRHWWGIAAAAAITAVIVGMAVLHHPSTTTPQQPTDIAQTDNDTLFTPPVVEAAPQQLASASPERPSHPVSPSRPVSPSTRNLKAENAKLARENERLQRELEDLRRRAFIIDMEANGFKAVMGEDGNIVFIDMEQEIENEFNHQPTHNTPEI